MTHALSASGNEACSLSVHSACFSIDRFLVEHLGHVPPRDYVGADPRKATSSPMSAFPSQWRDVCALTTPPNGFSSQPWWNDKAARKERWQAWGLDSSLLVPTLFHTYIDTEYLYDEGDPPFVEDSFGQLALAWHEPQIVHSPHDKTCRAKLQQMLRLHASLVVKPIEGNRAEGVQLVCQVEGESDTDSDHFDVAVRRHTSEVKLIKSKLGERMPFKEWFEQGVVKNPQIKTGILVEPMVEWDNEVTFSRSDDDSLESRPHNLPAWWRGDQPSSCFSISLSLLARGIAVSRR